MGEAGHRRGRSYSLAGGEPHPWNSSGPRQPPGGTAGQFGRLSGRRARVAVLLATLAMVPGGWTVMIPTSCYRPFIQTVELQAEAVDAINSAKAATKDLGGMLTVVLSNDGDEPLGVADVRWDNRGLAEHAEGFGLVWQRLQPDPIPPGGEGVLSLCLRRRLQNPTDLTVHTRDGKSVTVTIPVEPPPVHLESISFGEGLRQAWLYVSVPPGTSAIDVIVYHNGTRLAAPAFRWLAPEAVAGTLVGALDLPQPAERGSSQVFRVEARTGADAAVVRAFDRWSIFGTYGGGDFEKHAINGLDGYNSFGKLDRPALDSALGRGIRCATMTGPNPPEDAYGHPGLYAYVLMDEPDCHDYSVADRPMGERIGAHAPQMLEFAQSCQEKDPLTPTLLTVDLTFTPTNYFYYGQIADIANPDCYAITAGWSVRVVRNYLDTVRQACAPRPFDYTYQGSWEEIAIKQERDYISGSELRQKGWDAFRDPDKVRGLGRAPHPDETAIMMLYGMGCGAKGLFSYIDSSEMCGTLMFHGSEDLPEIWEIVGRLSRTLRQVAPLVDVGYPVTLASASDDLLWVRTVLCGSDAALIVVVNEDFSCDKDGFRQQTKEGVVFSLPRLPWAEDWRITRVDDGILTSLDMASTETTLGWRDTVRMGGLYLAAPAAVSAALASRYQRLESDVAAGIVAQRRATLVAERNRRMRVQDLLADPVASRLVGEPIHGYGVTDGALWNPRRETYNGVDFWEREGTSSLGVQWSLDIGPEQVAAPQRLVWQGRLYGGEVTLVVTSPDGSTMAHYPIAGAGTATIREQALTFTEPGVYRVAVTVAPTEPREHGGRIARLAFLLPR